jgi:hypothetical protein
MIRLKTILQEIAQQDIKFALTQIQQKKFRLLGAGDNGRVYEIDDTDLVFKITSEPAEYEIATKIVNRAATFSTFIPIFYVDGKNMYIMNNADELPGTTRMDIDRYMQDYKAYARSEGGEVSVFDFLQVCDRTAYSQIVINFLDALQADIRKLNIADIELELDFNTGNIMTWNGSLVMVDW